nr:AlpA family phage regulatory protein [Paraburkholderia terrae]
MLRLMGVLEAVGVSKSTLYQWIKDGHFVAPVRLGPRAVAWRSDDVDAWMASRQPARTDAGQNHVSA